MSLSTLIFDKGVNGTADTKKEKSRSVSLLFLHSESCSHPQMEPGSPVAPTQYPPPLVSLEEGSVIPEPRAHRCQLDLPTEQHLTCTGNGLTHTQLPETSGPFPHDEEVTAVKPVPCQTSTEKRLCSPPLRAPNGVRKWHLPK